MAALHPQKPCKSALFGWIDRPNRTQEVAGSSPASSIEIPADALLLGGRDGAAAGRFLASQLSGAPHRLPS